MDLSLNIWKFVRSSTTGRKQALMNGARVHGFTQIKIRDCRAILGIIDVQTRLMMPRALGSGERWVPTRVLKPAMEGRKPVA